MARPLRKTYLPTAPYVATRRDRDNGTISFEVFDERPDSYRFVCSTSDDYGTNPYAAHDAKQIALGLNLLVRNGKETLPRARKTGGDDAASDD